MTNAAIAGKLEPGSTEQYGALPEKDDPTKLQCAAIFDACIEQVKAGDGVSIEEYEFTSSAVDRVQAGLKLGRIIANTPVNEASVITIVGLDKAESIKHIFFLRKESKSGKKSLETFFEIGFNGADMQSVHLMQTIKNGKDTKEKIINVDANGNIQDTHADKSGRSRPRTNPKVCLADLAVVADTVAEPVEEAIMHTTQEFDRVENPIKPEVISEEVPVGLFRAAVFGVKHRGETLEIAA